MKIYYVCKDCKVKGPAFLRLAGNEYLEAGDICIVNGSDKTIVYFLKEMQQSWNDCKAIDILSISIQENWANVLLYSYDGFNKRHGDSMALEKIIQYFKNSIICPLLENASEVLKHKKDLIDIATLQTIFQTLSNPLSKSSTNIDKNAKIGYEKIAPENVYFISFLEQKLIDYVKSLIAEGKTSKAIISSLRQTYPSEFREAFVQFNEYKPTGSIYEGLMEFFESNKLESGDTNIGDGKLVVNKNYEEIFRNLRVNTTGNSISPHKPILLLAVIEMVEKGEIVSPFIPISKELEVTFERLWKQYGPEGEEHKRALQNPFYYMKSESFWRLEPLPWHIEKTSYSLKDLRQNFYGAIIDEELFDAFSIKKKCDTLKSILVSSVFTSADTDNFKSLNTISNEIPESRKSLNDFDKEVISKIDGDVNNELKIKEFSDKSIVVYGEASNLSKQFRNIGGYYVSYLKEGAGWIFPKNKMQEVESIIHITHQNILPILEKEIDVNQLNTRVHAVEKSISNNSLEEKKSKYAENQNKWIKILLDMFVRTKDGISSPHKCIFILALIDGIKNHVISSEIIYPSERLSTLYDSVWDKYVPDNCPYTSNFYHSFIHMNEEDFYSLEKVSGLVSFNINMEWTYKSVNRFVKYCILDTSLYKLLKNKKFVTKLEKAIVNKLSNIDKFISDNDEDPIESDYDVKVEELQEEKNELKPENFELSQQDFRRYLSLISTENGKPSPTSDIQFYMYQLDGLYVMKKVRNFDISGNIFRIRQYDTILKIIDDVKNDYTRGLTNSTCVTALELFLQFVQFINHKEIPEKNNVNIKNDSFKKEREILVMPYGAKVDKIECIDFTISGECKSSELLKRFVTLVGVEKVYQLRIPFLGGYLVDKTRNQTYISNCKYIEGFWLNTAGSLSKKVEQMQVIAQKLNMHINIEISK